MSAIIPQRPLGSQGLYVSAQGLGCMGMTAFYGNFDRNAQEAESLRTFSKGLELGINFLDTAWIYQSFGVGGGHFYNEELVGKALAMHGRDKFIVATKFGATMTGVSSNEATVRSQLEESLQRLGTDYIDLYYMHRVDPTIPIEDTMRLLKSFVEEGKIKYIGLSECTDTELRRAHAIHPITAIQMEWSLQSRDIENSIVPCARELGVGIVAYSPLGRGFLTALNAFDNLDETDRRRHFPRFSSDNLEENKMKAARFFDIAKEKNCTPAQLALAWVHSKGNDVFPIPGTKTAARIEENANSINVVLSPEEILDIEASVSVIGDRYDTVGMQRTFQGRL